MNGSSTDPAEGSEQPDAREEIMRATYHILCAEGYAGLTMRAIATEAGTSKSLIHYHYDTKDDLLLAFLDRFIDRLDKFLAEIQAETDDHEARLVAFLDRFVVEPDEDERQSFWRALLELRLRAAHDEEFREQLEANNEAIREALTAIIAEGIADGAFREVDPRATADLILDALEGARTRQATLGTDDAPLGTHESVREHVVSDLIA